MFGIARHMLVRRADQPARVVMRSFAAGSFKASPVLLRERGNPSAAGSRPHGEGQHSTMDKLIEETRKLLVNLVSALSLAWQHLTLCLEKRSYGSLPRHAQNIRHSA